MWGSYMRDNTLVPRQASAIYSDYRISVQASQDMEKFRTGKISSISTTVMAGQ